MRQFKCLAICCFLLINLVSFAQVGNFCNDDSCGALDPSWQLDGTRTVACEGERFSLRSGESDPYDNIDSYTWILTNTLTGEELIREVFTDTIPLEFEYTVSDSIACITDRINIEVRLIVTSPECAEGESCRYSAEPLTVIFKPRARFSSESLVCINDPITFTNESCNADSYAWDFDADGVTDSTDPNPEFSFSTPGSYTVSLTATNECGSDVRQRTIEVVGFPEANIELAANGGQLCMPDQEVIRLVANEWVTDGPSGFFSWEISPAYTDMNGDWCFVDPNSNGQTCLRDEDFTENTVDSLLRVQEELVLFFRAAGEYTVTLNYGNVCDELSTSETIFVYQPVSISGLQDISGCDAIEVCFDELERDNFSVSGNYQSVQWVFENASQSTSSQLDFGCITFERSGSMTLEVSANDPCMDRSETVAVNVVETQTVTVPNPSPNIICQNAGLIDLNPSATGGTYFYNNVVADFIVDDQLNPANLAPGDYTVQYVLSDNPDCPAEDAFSFSIQEGPFIELGENEAACESISNFNPRVLASGGDIDTWQWNLLDDQGNRVSSSSNPLPAFAVDDPGTYTIEVTLMSDECGSVTDSALLIIQANEEIVIEPFNNPYCQGSSVDTLIATPPGGVWVGEGIINDSLGLFDPGALAPSSYPMRYVIENDACSAEATATIEVVASANVEVRDTFFCVTDETGQLFVSVPGGVFEGTGVIDGELGLFNPAEAMVGDNAVVYTLMDDNGCEVVKNLNVAVDEVPILSVSDTIFVCIGDDNVDLRSLVIVDAQGETGTFSYSGQGIVDPSAGTFNGANMEAGFYTLYVDFNARACSARDSFVLELAEKPALILPEDETVCLTDGTLTLTASPAGGVWSSPNCSINAETGEVNLTNSGENDCSFFYTLGAGTTCEQSDVVNISIVDLADDLQVPQPTSICYSSDHYTLPNFSPTGGTWSGEGVTDTINGVIAITQLEQGASYTYTYCIEAPEIDCRACKETVLTIEPLPVASFELAGSPCQFQEFNLINTSTGSVSYEWFFEENAPPKTDEAPSHIYTTAGTQTIMLVARTAFGCTDTVRQQVDVTAPPNLELDISTTEGCAPLHIQYVNGSSGEGVRQFWIIDGVDTLFDASPDIILDSVLTDSVITLELVVANDCEVLRQSKDILVHPYPLVDFGINDDEGCSPDTVFLVNATLGMPDSFLWNFGNGMETTLADPLPQIYTSPDDSVSTYTISLFASNQCGQGFLEKEILVYPNNVDAFFEIDTLSGCPPLAVTIRNYATNGATVAYDFGDGGTGNTADTTYVYTKPGQYVITQYASLCGTDIRQSDTITVFPLANIEFDIPSFACVGEPVQFTNQSTNGVVSRWLFGDGSFSDQVNPTHIYQSHGTYAVSLIVNSEFHDCPDTLTKTILIPEPPIASFQVDSLALCEGGLVQFLDESIRAQNYEWYFGEGEGGSEMQNPTYRYLRPGTFEVQLRVYDEYECAADTSINNLLVHPNPLGRNTISADEICQLHDTLLVRNTSEGYVNSIWYLNDTWYAEQQDELRISANTVGEQEIELISISPFGCRDTQHIHFEVLPSPTAQANWIDTSGCQPFTVPFQDLSINSDITSWYFDLNNQGADSLEVHTFLDSGTFPATLVAANSNGCPADTLVMTVDVFPRAMAEFEVAPFDSCGVPVDIELINLTQFGSDFLWRFGNGDTSTFFAPLVEYEQEGTYAIELIASNAYACADTVQQEITLYPFTVAGFNLPNTQLCEGDTVTINNTSTGSNEYCWLVNGIKADSFPLILTQSGRYDLSLIASYDQHCHDTFHVSSAITIYDSPEAGFTAITDESQDILGDVRFVNESRDATDFRWEFGDGQTSNEENPEHEYDINGPVSVCLYSFNDNNGILQCVDKAQQLVEFELINTFFVPKALSPDQNFGNSEIGVFKPKGIGIASYELNIYSPWGDKVATLNQVLNGEPIDWWDGTFQGQPVSQGAYPWTARIKYRSGQEDFKKGNVTVVR